MARTCRPIIYISITQEKNAVRNRPYQLHAHSAQEKRPVLFRRNATNLNSQMKLSARI